MAIFTVSSKNGIVSPMNKVIEKKIKIAAPVTGVWQAITEAGLMAKWMGGPELRLEIDTTWETGTPITIKGFHHIRFENKGTVLEYIPGQAVSYDFLSSLSRLPDTKENYTVIRFSIAREEDQTLLTLLITNFPTETIYQHLNFYWNATIVLLKKCIEQPYN